MSITGKAIKLRLGDDGVAGPGPGGSTAFFGAIIQATDPQTIAVSGAADVLLPTIVEDEGGLTGTANVITFPFAGTWDVLYHCGIKKTNPGDTLTGGVFAVELFLPSNYHIEEDIWWEELNGGSSNTGRSLVWSGHADEGNTAHAYASNYMDVDIDILSRDDNDRGAVLSARLRKAD